MKPLRFTSLFAGALLALNLVAQTSNAREVTVKVRDASGQPISGVTVDFYPTRNDTPWRKQSKLKSGTTSSDGIVKFEIADPLGQIVARKTGMAIAGYFVSRREEMVALTMSQPVSVSGIVVDEADHPVPDAKIGVRLMLTYRENEFSGAINAATTPDITEDLSTRTGADGRFRIDGVPTNSTIDLCVTRSGKTVVRPSRDHIGPDTMMCRAGQQDIKLRLQPAASIEGKVLISGENYDMSRIFLTAYYRIPEGGWYLFTQARADGSFSFADLLPGKYEIRAHFGTNEASERVGQQQTVTVQSGQVLGDLHIAASKGGVLEMATFLDGEHTPLVNVNFHAQDVEDLMSSESGNTGERGVGELRLFPGRYRVSANKEGWRSQETVVQIEEGKTNRVKMALAPLPKIQGTLRDTNGAPAAGMEVRLFPVLGSSATTDTNGHFQLKTSPGMQDQWLLARDRDRNLAVAREIENGTETYNLQLAPALMISGQVQTEKREPLTNAIIDVFVKKGGMGLGMETERHPKFTAQGRFEVPALPLGHNYSVHVTAKGYGSASLDVNTDEHLFDLGIVTLRVADKRIAGLVRDLEDKPVKKADVSIYGNGQPSTYLYTDENGRFSFNEVCDGWVNISVSASSEGGQSFGSARVDAGDTNIVVTLNRQIGGTRPQARRASLVGNPLPDLTAAGLPADILPTNKPLLICLFDPEQRSSLRLLRLLAERKDLKEKGLQIVCISAALMTADSLKQWKQSNPQPFPIGGVTNKNDTTQWILSAEKVPWLIATDPKWRVKAEGFDLEDLDTKLK